MVKVLYAVLVVAFLVPQRQACAQNVVTHRGIRVMVEVPAGWIADMNNERNIYFLRDAPHRLWIKVAINDFSPRGEVNLNASMREYDELRDFVGHPLTPWYRLEIAGGEAVWCTDPPMGQFTGFVARAGRSYVVEASEDVPLDTFFAVMRSVRPSQ